jgi:hypothetical protein
MQNRIELHRQWDVILNLSASGDNYYKVDGLQYHRQSSIYRGFVLIQSGQNLLLGGEIQTYQPEFGVTVTMHYAIDQNTTFCLA